MTLLLPPPRKSTRFASFVNSKRCRYAIAAVVDLILIVIILMNATPPAQQLISPLISPLMPLKSLTESHKGVREVFGFIPYWNINKTDNINFKILTTLSYFGVEVDSEGNLDKESIGYQTFTSSKATKLFKEAHQNGTKVVLTLTQMKNANIRALMDNPDAQKRAIAQAVRAVKERGIDGLNIDLEYTGDPGEEYRQKFTQFVADATTKMHQEIPQSYVTVSVYASAVKDPKIYDIARLSNVTDGIFMMAYDFAVAGSDNAIPTSPLYGHKNGKYWYDVASAVDDFLRLMPSQKLILGVPYYGYNYLVYEPEIKAETRPWYSWRGKPATQTYAVVQEKFKSDEVEGVDQIKRGWDDDGKVSYIAYHVTETDTWRMVFIEDTKSLGLKYDFAKDKNLGGVGIWALGNDENRSELWALLDEKFGSKALVSNEIFKREVADIIE